MPKITALWLLVCLFLIPGCATGDDVTLSALMQKGEHHALIKEIQPRLDKGGEVTSFQLLLLGSAYYEVRRYQKVLTVADLMDKRVAAGDDNFFGGDLSLYPAIFRAATYLDQGEYAKAIDLAARAGSRLKQNQIFYRAQLIQLSNILGVANAFLGHPELAREHLAVISRVDLEKSNLGPEKFIAMARIHLALKEYGKALLSVDDPRSEVPASLRIHYDPTFQAVPRFFIRCKSLYETGKQAQAKQGYDQLLKHPQISQFGGIHWRVLQDRARIAQAEGAIAEAIKMLEKAIEIIEQQRSSIDSESGRIGFVGDKQSLYHALVSLLLSQGLDARAFEYVERSKARALVDLLATQKSFAARPREAQGGDILLRLMGAESDLVALAGPEQAAATRSVAAYEIRRNLKAQAPELASLVSVASTPLKEIQQSLQPDEALLEYYYTDQELVAFVVAREGLKAVRLERAGLEDRVIKFRASLSNADSRDYLPQSEQIYNRLFKPLLGSLKARKLVVVPHGLLHYLPFYALRSERGFLIDDYSLRVEPSASVLQLIAGRRDKAVTTALLLGNPDLGNARLDLQFAQEEASSIARILPNAKVLLRREATPDFVKHQGGRFPIIHFAAHGLFNPADPMNSAVLLAPDRSSDGRLKVSDLYSLSLDANLVTLSACQTALGKVTTGDDVVGFARGLLYAGASSIVSSLWDVDDLATRDLMVGFYQNLAKMDKQEALRQAQINTRKKYEHPNYWAAFILTGNAR